MDPIPSPEPTRADLFARLGEAYRTGWEPSAWLRLRAESAALHLAADSPPYPPGSRVIVPLTPVPVWAATARPEHVCARCGAHDDPPDPDGPPRRPEPGEWRQCGLEARSDAMPGVLFAFTFTLCRSCAAREWAADAGSTL